MKKTIDIRERVRVRAYYLSLRYPAASALSCWLLAERTEQQLATRRAAAAKKAAATRRANAILNPPPGSRPALLAIARGRTPSAIIAH